MPTHDIIPFTKPKTAEDLKVPPERLADYLGLTKYGIEVMRLTQEDLLKVASGLMDQ